MKFKFLFFVISFVFGGFIPAIASSVKVDLVSTDIQIIDSSPIKDIGLFTLKFKVTAVDGDIYIPARPFGFNFAVERQGLDVNVETAMSVTSASDNGNGPVFEILEGESELFTSFITVEPKRSGQHRVRLTEVEWSEGTMSLDPKVFKTGYVGLRAREGIKPIPHLDPSICALYVFGCFLLVIVAARRRK